ncbi:MAG: ATP-binding protein [Lachnospiraceae bacterium]|nr:ATP-binding protein [Lachnospiraceae bacterium]
MPKSIAIGLQDFEKVRRHDAFYVDKTQFIADWWLSNDDVTLITRPRRFGKTLTVSMVEQFFSIDCAGSGLFNDLKIWSYEKMRALQGSYPVISLSFSDIKENSYAQVRGKLCESIVDLYNHYDFLAEGDLLNEREKEYFNKVSSKMEDSEISIAIRRLSGYLYKYYHQKVILLLDEYDTPMLEAFTGGYWNELTSFMRSLFNATFKNNPYMERAILTGITRISKESIFSDLNTLKVVTTTSEEYADCFGFTESEVFAALDDYGFSDKKQDVRDWYDGFSFGSMTGIYNPWSILNFLDTGRLEPYWANTSSNTLTNTLIRSGSKDIKIAFEALLHGSTIKTRIDEQIVYSQLLEKESSIWSLFLASGYLKVVNKEFDLQTGRSVYELSLTNREVRIMFEDLIHCWFSDYDSNYNDFVKSMLQNDKKAMNVYMSRVALNTFSFFDAGNKPSEESEPERFYHGFVLGLIVDLADRYAIQSNRESGLGRYDVILEPKNTDSLAFIIEFKVFDPDEESSLTDTVQRALRQIEDKKYAAALTAKGIPAESIRSYGFAFKGKQVLIG